MTTEQKYEPDEYAPLPNGGKQTKVEKYGWILRDRPGEFMMVDKNELSIDYEYQRDKVIIRKVRELQSNWSWAGCGCILVAMRQDGSFWVFDGQHRVLAARNRADISILPCLVFEVDNKTQEAAGFLVSNTQRKPVTAIAKFKAMVMTGDPTAVAVDSLLKKLGLTVCDTAAHRHELKCVAVCLKHATSGVDVLEAALRAALALDGDEPVHRDMLDGLTWIHKKYRLLSDTRFMRRFSGIGRADIVSAMNRFAIAQENRSDKVCGMAILQCVNKGLRQRFGDIDE